MTTTRVRYGGHAYVVTFNTKGEPTRVEERDPRDGYLITIWQLPRPLRDPLIRAIVAEARPRQPPLGMVMGE